MYIGLILLAIIAVLTFFGLLSNTFYKVGVRTIYVLVALLIFAVCLAIPDIAVSENISLSISGIVLLSTLLFILLFAVISKTDVLRALVSGICLSLILIGLRVVFIEFLHIGVTALAVVSGITLGIVAYVVSGDMLSILFSVTMGVVLGDVTATVLLYYRNIDSLFFGTYGTFDVFVIAIFSAFLLSLFLSFVQEGSKRQELNRTAFNMEVSGDENVQEQSLKDVNIIIDDEDMKEFDDYFSL